MSKTSSNRCDWMPTNCCECGDKIRKSIDQFMAYMDDITGETWTLCVQCLLRRRNG